MGCNCLVASREVAGCNESLAIIDLCRPSDIHQTQLQEAAIRKQQAYKPLVEGLSYYTEQGWVVHVFPLIVGIRWVTVIDSYHVQSLLKFLDIQRKRWQIVIEQTAFASVRAFHFDLLSVSSLKQTLAVQGRTT